MPCQGSERALRAPRLGSGRRLCSSAAPGDDGRMMERDAEPATIECRPVTDGNAADLTRFSERHGKFRYCSCMRWRMTSTEYKQSTKQERINELDDLVRSRAPVGVLAYVTGEPVGWCAVAPRADYRALERFRALPRLDDQRVWSVVCFFVDARFRREGVTRTLLAAAVEYARSQGARVIEGYPVEPGPRSYTYMGSPATFRAVGFDDVTPAGQARTVMRYISRR